MFIELRISICLKLRRSDICYVAPKGAQKIRRSSLSINIPSLRDCSKKLFTIELITSLSTVIALNLLIQNLAPLLLRGTAHFRTRFRDRGKLAHPFIRPARIDDGARAVTLLTFRNDWIKRPAPTAPNCFNVDLRIRARRQRPQHIVRIGYVDVIIDYDHVTTEVSARVAVGGNHSRLLCVTGIALLDRNDRQKPRATGFVAPHSLYVDNSGCFHLLPDQS